MHWTIIVLGYKKKKLIDGKTAEFAWYPTQYNEAAERERESTFTWLSYIWGGAGRAKLSRPKDRATSDAQNWGTSPPGPGMGPYSPGGGARVVGTGIPVSMVTNRKKEKKRKKATCSVLHS